MSHFNDVANDWDNQEKIKRAYNLAQTIRKEIDLDKKFEIMDFGCGTGLLGFELIDNAKTLLGIDTSPGMLEIFNLKTKGLDNVESLNINLEEQELSRKFDLIVSSMAFHHLDRPEEMLMKFSKMLNENGKMLIVDLETEDGSFHPNNEAMGVKHYGFSQDELSSWADKSNLSVDFKVIDHIEKNDRSYNLFLGVFS